DVSRHHRGARADRRDLRAASASLHDGAPLGGARGGRTPAGTLADGGRAAQRGADSPGVPGSSPVSPPGRARPAGVTAPRRATAPPSGRVSRRGRPPVRRVARKTV